MFGQRKYWQQQKHKKKSPYKAIVLSLTGTKLQTKQDELIVDSGTFTKLNNHIFLRCW